MVGNDGICKLMDSLMKTGSNAWGIPPGSTSLQKLQTSSDASLFSSSLPVLPHEKLKGTETNGGQSVDDSSAKIDELKDAMSSPLDFEEPMSLLPDDEEALLAGIMDDFELNRLPNQLDEPEDYDIFDSSGGMEMDFDPTENLSVGLAKTTLNDGYGGNGISHFGVNGVGTIAGEHPYGEHPSRTLFVRNINSNVEDAELRTLFEQYGDIRTLYTACKHRGFVMISYYDIRAARTAMRALQNKPLRRRKLDIHFSIPKDNPSDKDMNQGTLVVFNLDPSVSNEDLLQIFGDYGEVKEIRETPHKRHHKFIEYYDIRSAEAALRSLNRIDIAGKRIKLEPSRPGGIRRNLLQQLTQDIDQDETRNFVHQFGSVTNSPPGLWAQLASPNEHSPLQSMIQSPPTGFNNYANSGNHLPGLASVLTPLNSDSAKIAPIGKDPRRSSNPDSIFSTSNPSQGGLFQQPHIFSSNNINAMMPNISSDNSNNNNASSSVGTLNGPQFLWGSPTYSENKNLKSDGHNVFYPSRHAPVHYHNNHHVGSAPSGIPFERQYGYFPESPDASYMRARNEANLLMNYARSPMNASSFLSGSFSDTSSPKLHMIPQRVGPAFFGNSKFSGFSGKKIDGSGSQLDSNKQYQLDLEKIASGEDTRTTLMIKNIPNKYTSKMLLAAIDETHKGTYDFLYLPIDFKNKCNVGYAFINMVSSSHIVSFYQAFNGKRWEKFNSEKVASLAYARIQGKVALVTHFQNSSLMNEDKRCRPILFHHQGYEASDQECNGMEVRVFDQGGTVLGDSSEL